MNYKDILKYLPKKDIPQDFHDFDGHHFKECVECGTNLLESDEPYLIEKALKPGDVIFEYSLCLKCAEEMEKELSEESKKAINSFFEGVKSKFEERMEDVVGEKINGLESCLVTGKPVSEMKEYQVFGMFQGDQMIVGPYPYVLDSSVIEELQENLSQKTKDFLDGFGDKHFGWPPELKDLLNPTPILI